MNRCPFPQYGVMITPAGEEGGSWGAALYDNVPGGAGHVFELMDLGEGWLEKARKIMYVTKDHHDCCITACLDCLLTYSAQQAMSMGLLQRLRAIEALDDLLSNREASAPPEGASPDSVQPSVTSASEEER